MQKSAGIAIIISITLLVFSCSTVLTVFKTEEPSDPTVNTPERTPIRTHDTEIGVSPAGKTSGDFLVNRNEGHKPKDVSAYRTSTPHEKIKTVPAVIQKNIFEQPEGTIDKLVGFLTEGEQDDFLKTKIIHDWIVDNISYDTEAFFSGNLGDTGYTAVLQKKRSVCDGYANLFKEMCGRAGIQSEKVSGYARGYGFSQFDREDFSKSNHAWNAVFIDNCWYLVDATWNAGAVDGGVFKKKYSTQYLFLAPEYIIYTHIPTIPAWQLLDNPYSPEVLETLPEYRGEYFEAGLKPVPGLTKVLQAPDNLAFSIPVPENTRLTAHLYETNGQLADRACLVQTESDTAVISVRFPKTGRWLLRIFAKEGKDSKFCLELGLEAAQGTGIAFPVLYTSFFESDMFLHSPLDNPLKAGESAEFRLKAPGYKKVTIIADGTIIPLANDADGVFFGKVVVPKAAKFGVYGSKSESASSFTGLIGYTVLP